MKDIKLSSLIMLFFMFLGANNLIVPYCVNMFTRCFYEPNGAMRHWSGSKGTKGVRLPNILHNIQPGRWVNAFKWDVNDNFHDPSTYDFSPNVDYVVDDQKGWSTVNKDWQLLYNRLVFARTGDLFYSNGLQVTRNEDGTLSVERIQSLDKTG